MPFSRTREDSDVDYAPPASKRRKKAPPIITERAVSMPPSSPGPPVHTHDSPEPVTPEAERPLLPLPPLPALFPDPYGSPLRASTTNFPETPHRGQSIEPPASSPMSVMNLTPVKPKPVKRRPGQPQHSPETHILHSTLRHLRGSGQSTPAQQEEFRRASETLQRKRAASAERRTAALKEEVEAAERVAKEEEEKATAEKIALHAQKTRDAQQVLADVTASTEDGGYNFKDLDEFFSAIFRTGGDYQASANLTRYVHSHGAQHAKAMFARSAPARDEYIDGELAEIFQKEGRAIQDILTRNSTTTVTDLLKQFSMDKLAAQIQEAAPKLWMALVVLTTPDESTRREISGEPRRNKGLVFTTICALISILRSQQANNFQLVIGLFLLGSGASKREMEVLAHAGLSISYGSITNHVKKLSKEGLANIRELVKTCMVQIVWDNLNIAFRIASERLDSKNHFDNGTTATVIPTFDPTTGGRVPHGTIPLSMKPPREQTLPVLDWSEEDVLPSPENAEQLSTSCYWLFQSLALDHIAGLKRLRQDFRECPVVNQIPLHKTEQLPLPAMHDEESTLEGSFTVYYKILKTMGMGDAELEAHGLMFDDGDLLTDSLKEKMESARRNSDTPLAGLRASVRRWGLFHGKMAGGRLTVNEHWGTPNSLWPGGLWWEHNKLLKRKPLSAGWSAKKATPWEPAHELITISLPAHIVDGFRIHCRHEDLSVWAETATMDEFNRVSKLVFDNLFSTAAVDKLRACPDSERDITLENAILYNRDALFYLEFVWAIKKGDIGRVLNVLGIWMVMMRTPKTMPRYADAMFETLVRLKKFPPKLRELFLANWLVNLTGREFGFKPVDLLQEHQNFWAKIIYNAKGTNKSWEWLSMITVCIFTLRDAMRTVQTAFEIPAYGDKHKTPDVAMEVTELANGLCKEKIQSFVANRPANDHVLPDRDLIKEGARYPNSRKAFWRFTREKRTAERRGFEPAERDSEAPDHEEEDGQEEDYTPTEDDLRTDDEEFFYMVEPLELLARAMDVVDSMSE